MKDALHDSAWLKTELQDGGLQNILAGIAGASHNVSHLGSNSGESVQEQLLRQTKMSNPAFATFLDKAMVIAGALERQGKDADGSMEEWLDKETEGPLHVSLKPLPCRPAAFVPSEDAAARPSHNGKVKDETSNDEGTSKGSDDDDDSEAGESSSSDDSSDESSRDED